MFKGFKGTECRGIPRERTTLNARRNEDIHVDGVAGAPGCALAAGNRKAQG
jgi:hypothetical protein